MFVALSNILDVNNAQATTSPLCALVPYSDMALQEVVIFLLVSTLSDLMVEGNLESIFANQLPNSRHLSGRHI